MSVSIQIGDYSSNQLELNIFFIAEGQNDDNYICKCYLILALYIWFKQKWMKALLVYGHSAAFSNFDNSLISSESIKEQSGATFNLFWKLSFVGLLSFSCGFFQGFTLTSSMYRSWQRHRDRNGKALKRRVRKDEREKRVDGIRIGRQFGNKWERLNWSGSLAGR